LPEPNYKVSDVNLRFKIEEDPFHKGILTETYRGLEPTS